MNGSLLLAVCFLAVMTQVTCQKYTDRYDNINLDEVLSNRRLLVPYVKCILDQGRCTAEGKELRSHITDALQNGCSKCTTAQRSGSRRVIQHLISNEPAYWDQLITKYDPKRVYVEQYENELKNAQLL